MTLTRIKQWALLLSVMTTLYLFGIMSVIVWHIPLLGQGLCILMEKIMKFKQAGVTAEDHMKSMTKLSFYTFLWKKMKFMIFVDKTCNKKGAKAIDVPVLKLSEDGRSVTECRLLDFMTSSRPLVLAFGSCS